MKREEALVDKYVTDSGVMFARLGDHLLILDHLRDLHKHASLDQFGLRANPAIYEGNLGNIVISHLKRYDVHMATYLKYAHVVLTYIVLEDRLHAFGQLIAALSRGASFAPNKEKRKWSMIAKFEDYLSSLSLVPPRNDAIDALRVIRNCIVHCRGCVSGLSERERGTLQMYRSSLVGVAVDVDDRLTLTTDGCLRLQHGAMNYVWEIDSAAGFHLWIPPEVRKSFEEHILRSVAN